MAHQYSVEIHSFLGKKLEETEENLEKARSGGNREEIRYQEGRLEALKILRQHMTEKFDLANRKYY